MFPFDDVPLHPDHLLYLKLLLLPFSVLFLYLNLRLDRFPTINNTPNAPPPRQQGRSIIINNNNKHSLIFVLSVSPASQSPRALAHASAISLHLNQCYVPVFVAHAPFPALEDPHLLTHALPVPPPSALTGNRSPLDLLRRLHLQFRTLLAGLDSCAATHAVDGRSIACILMCVPPSIPTILVTKYWIWKWKSKHGSNIKLLIDWHNTTASILAVHGTNRAVVRVVSVLESLCKHLADFHWCVTEAMQRALNMSQNDCKSLVLYDYPDQLFRPFTRHNSDPNPVHQLLLRLSHAAHADPRLFNPGTTALTCATGARWRNDPYKLAISSTSWTPDEDFAPLIEAIRLLDAHLGDDNNNNNDNKLLLVITGKGPLRNEFEATVRDMKLTNILVWCAWLSREDYAELLAVCDTGISMHQSSSGIDLPMKAVDMLGAGIPVISRNYHCIDELIKNNHNGILFNTASQLKDALVQLLFQRKKNSSSRKLQRMRSNAANTFPSDKRWAQVWKNTAMPSLLRLLEEDDSRDAAKNKQS